MTDRDSLSAFAASISVDRWRKSHPELRHQPRPRKGDVWAHSKTGNEYVIDGIAWDCITDQLTVQYRSVLVGTAYTRQLSGHPKAFHSIDDAGRARFVLAHRYPA